MMAEEKIKIEGYKAQALSSVAQALAQAGDRDKALAAAEKIGNEYSKTVALIGVAQALAQAGDCEGALAAAKKISGEKDKAEALTTLTLTLSQVGDVNSLRVFRLCLQTARFADRQVIFACLKAGAKLLADRGNTLRKVYERVIEVDEWWGESSNG